MRQIGLIYIVTAALVLPGQGSAQQGPLPNASWGWSDPSRGASSTIAHPLPLRIGRTLPVRVSWTGTDITLATGFAAAALTAAFEEAFELTLDVMRNASNKIAVSLAADAPRVLEGTERYLVDADGQTVFAS